MTVRNTARNRQTASRRGGLTRRRFLGTAAATGVLLATARVLRLADGPDEVHMSQLGKLTIRDIVG